LLYLMGAMVWYVVTSLVGRLGRGSVVVLCYHGIRDVQMKSFWWQMFRVSGKAVEMLAFERMESLRTTGHPKVCITFDDAFANLLDNALPGLEEYRIPAIVFAVAGNLGSKPRWRMRTRHPESNEMSMTKEQLTALSKHELVRIGSHTMTHVDLATISTDRIKEELTNSKESLEELLGCPIEDIALPHGSYNEEVLALAQDAGYKRIYTLDPKPVRAREQGPVIGRFSMSPDVWKIEFLLTCAGAYTWLYPWRAVLASIRRRVCTRDRRE